MVCLRIMKWDMAKVNRDHGRETAQLGVSFIAKIWLREL